MHVNAADITGSPFYMNCPLIETLLESIGDQFSLAASSQVVVKDARQWRQVSRSGIDLTAFYSLTPVFGHAF